jgi:hypothetical protein
VNIVQVENVVIDGKDAFGAVADHLRVSVVAPGERELLRPIKEADTRQRERPLRHA